MALNGMTSTSEYGQAIQGAKAVIEKHQKLKEMALISLWEIVDHRGRVTMVLAPTATMALAKFNDYRGQMQEALRTGEAPNPMANEALSVRRLDVAFLDATQEP